MMNLMLIILYYLKMNHKYFHSNKCQKILILKLYFNFIIFIFYANLLIKLNYKISIFLYLNYIYTNFNILIIIIRLFL